MGGAGFAARVLFGQLVFGVRIVTTAHAIPRPMMRVPSKLLLGRMAPVVAAVVVMPMNAAAASLIVAGKWGMSRIVPRGGWGCQAWGDGDFGVPHPHRSWGGASAGVPGTWGRRSGSTVQGGTGGRSRVKQRGGGGWYSRTGAHGPASGGTGPRTPAPMARENALRATLRGFQASRVPGVGV